MLTAQSINMEATHFADTQKRLYVVGQVIICSFLIALCSQIRIPLFFTPVPITLQTFAVLLVGAMLGSRKGALAVVLYLTETTFGLPFLSGGRSDPLALVSPVGGYLLGFVFQAYLAGWFAERQARLGNGIVFAGMLISSAVQLMMGGAWLAYYVGWSHMLLLGILPFVPGELVKIMVATTILNRNGVKA